MPLRRVALVCAAGLLLSLLSAPAHAAVPDWVRPALRYLVDHELLRRDSFAPNRPMRRGAFKKLIDKGFGAGHYSRTEGYVNAGEVDALLVRLSGHGPLARSLKTSASPDGWRPELHRRFGTEVVARELGLRHDRPTSEEQYEAGYRDRMTQADIAWAVWRTLVGPDAWAASALQGFRLSDYGRVQRAVVEFALAQAGAPYYWSGEWPTATPASYPYGAQPAGGFDCSGFIWYVLQKKSASYSPVRSYEGWSLPERSSSAMAKAAPVRVTYRNLKPAMVMFFGPRGTESKARDVYHAGLYLGGGWMVHSSGSRDGVSLAPVGKGSWWRSQFAWGRRVIR